MTNRNNTAQSVIKKKEGSKKVKMKESRNTTIFRCTMKEKQKESRG